MAAPTRRGTRPALPSGAVPGSTDAFIHRVGEELRTPLTIATGMLQVYRRRHPLDDGEAEYLLDRGEAALDRLAVLVEDLVLASRLASGVHVPSQQPVAARPLLLDVAARAAEPRQVRVDCDPQLVLRTDPVLLGRAVAALVDNALVHGGGAEVVAHAGAVEVCDRGPGLPADVLARLQATGAAAEPAVMGPGVGLDLVRVLADHLGATLTVRSDPGAGTAVRVALPG